MFARCVMVMLVLAACSAEAKTASISLTGDKLLQRCNDRYGDLYCIGFVQGVAEVLKTGNSIGGVRACIPRSISVGQARDVSVVWLESHPKFRRFPAMMLVVNSLSEAFPCN